MIRLIRKTVSFITELLDAIRSDDIIPYAHQLTMSLILAFFPFVMFLTTLLGFLNLDSSAVLQGIQHALPESVFPFVSDIITDVLDRQRSGLLSFAIILAVYSASGGFRAFMKGSNRITGIQEHRPLLLRYLLSIIWVILFALTLVVVLVAFVFGGQILKLIDQLVQIPLVRLIDVLRYVVPLFMIVSILTLFYMFGPSRRVRFRYALPGAIFTTVSWSIVTLLFRYYVDHYADYSRFYGALGSLIALLLWLQLNSTILLIGVEINAVVMTRRGIDLSFAEASESSGD